MSLIFCPECGHEVSANAVACPNCGRPLVAPEPTVVVRRRQDSFPPWGIPAIAAAVVLLGLLLFFLFRSPADDSSNVNVALRANANRSLTNVPATRTEVPPSEPSTVSIPPSSSAPVMPPTVTSAAPPSMTSVPPTATGAPSAPDRGTAVIRAQVVGKRGDTVPAKSARFYLLDKDPEEILSQARIDPIEGNTLTSSLGLASVFPDRFGDFQRAAMRAIAAHAKYTGTTDSTGQASVGNVAPKQYYLFAIYRVGHGFAMWNSPVSIVGGENMLDLGPVTVTEIDNTSGE